MKILAFDTNLNTMYVTIAEDSRILVSEEVKTTKERYNSALLIPTIIKLLKEKNLLMQDIDTIGVNVGPGSFTGIRASATVARVMGQNLDIPIIGIPSLQIISLINDTDKNALCLLDARKGKAYTAIYTHDGEIIQEPAALDYEEVVKLAKSGDFYIIADIKAAEKLKSEGIESVDFTQKDYDLGTYLARLTYKYAQQGDLEKFKWFNLKPLYIQPPPITISKNVKM